MCLKSQWMLWGFQLLQPTVWILFAVWISKFNSEYEYYAGQCNTSLNVNDAVDYNCPADVYVDADTNTDNNKECNCIEIDNQCQIAYNITNCIGSTYSCECQSLPLEILINIFSYTILADILFFELIKLLIIWRVCCIISSMRSKPDVLHDPSCLKCSIQTLGNSFLLRCIMCNSTGKSVVLYMYHRGMLLKSCGCCCIFFFQTMIGGALIFLYGYVFMIGLINSWQITFASPKLYYATLIICCVWILLQFIYCCSPQYTNDDKVKQELKNYKVPFAYDVISTGYKQPQPQQIPLQVQPQPIQPQPMVQPQVVYVQQQLANGQIVYMQQPQLQPQQVVIVPQSAPSVVSSSGGVSDYQVIHPSALAPLNPGYNEPMPVANAPPAINPEFEEPPPMYNQAGYDDGESGYDVPGQVEGGVTNM